LGTVGDPPPVMGASLTYDPASSVDVLSGGQLSSGHLNRQTWSFDGTRWKLLSTQLQPEGAMFATMGYDAALGSIVRVGGFNASGTPINRTHVWLWNGSTWTLDYSADPPPGLAAGTLVNDPSDRGALLLGALSGSESHGSYVNSAYLFVSGRWIDTGKPLPHGLIGGALDSGSRLPTAIVKEQSSLAAMFWRCGRLQRSFSGC
jgi:hypothetical protein